MGLNCFCSNQLRPVKAGVETSGKWVRPWELAEECVCVGGDGTKGGNHPAQPLVCGGDGPFSPPLSPQHVSRHLWDGESRDLQTHVTYFGEGMSASSVA